jgi:TonB family protein
MSNYLNYLVEANLGLVIFLAAYTLFLRKETDFIALRLFLLAAVLGSVIFPIIRFPYYQPNIVSIGQLIPVYLLPEVTIGDQPATGTLQSFTENNLWYFAGLLYTAGLVFFLTRFILRLVLLIRKTRSAALYKVGQCSVVESDSKQTFSFFRYIFLSQPGGLTSDEKNKIILHETVHARQFHSFDILLINIIGIFFWFNPLLIFYKKIFIQLHEFEADARAVENRDANAYCSLLAKVALQSVGFPLANHFNNSLTLKRITMMRTIKHKIKGWKIITMTGIIPLVFFIVACQDQVTSDVQDVPTATNIPAEVQTRIDLLKQANPEKRFAVIETTTDEGWATLGKIKQTEIVTMNLITPTAKPGQEVRTFAILELGKQPDKAVTESKPGDDFYIVVDETATPVSGMTEYYNYIAHKLRYPLEARQKGIEGKVFVEFIVDIDGSIEVTGVSGIGAGCELEAMRVVQSSPKWYAGKNKGIPVRQKMVLPINFTLNASTYKDPSETPEAAMDEMVVVGKPKS